jgi:cysteine sulfinate desulfinase/cysteine desulfurase-like protein
VLLCAAGAPCHHGSTQPSATLRALGLSDAEALRTFRMSVGAESRETEMEAAVEILAECVLRASSK